MHYLEVVQDPANATFCEGTNATLTCTIFDNSTDRIANSTSWVNLTSGRRIISNMHMNALVKLTQQLKNFKKINDLHFEMNFEYGPQSRKSTKKRIRITIEIAI